MKISINKHKIILQEIENVKTLITKVGVGSINHNRIYDYVVYATSAYLIKNKNINIVKILFKDKNIKILIICFCFYEQRLF